MTHITITKIHTEDFMNEAEKKLINDYNECGGNTILFFNDMDIPTEDVELYLKNMEYDLFYPFYNKYSSDVARMIQSIVEAHKYIRVDTDSCFDTLLLSF